MKIEVVPGDAVLFLGRTPTQSSMDIVGQYRKIVGIFSHKRSMNYWKREKLTPKDKKKGSGDPIEIAPMEMEDEMATDSGDIDDKA